MWQRRAVLLGAPLALGVLEVFHPRGLNTYEVIAADTSRWLAVHLLQLPLFGLVALAVVVLVRGLTGWAASVTRISMAFFVVFYTALDSMAGIAAGVLVWRAQHLPPAQQQVIAAQIDALSANFTAPFAGGGGPAFMVSVLGGLGWVTGLVTAAVAVRRAGSPARRGDAGRRGGALRRPRCRHRPVRDALPAGGSRVHRAPGSCPGASVIPARQQVV